MSYFPESYACSKNRVNVELDLSNYGTLWKSDRKGVTGIVTSNLKQANLTSKNGILIS